jgi:hypothetical protein
VRGLHVALLLAVLAARGGFAAEEQQVDWVGDWEAAFKAAQESKRPVMVCINSKDGEQANERAATTTCRDPLFVTLSRRFVMVVVSTRKHAPEGPCPRFGKVTCEEHLDCWKALRAQHGESFLLPGTSDTMISPQHAWFASDGKLLERKEYELARGELLKRMSRVLVAVGGEPAPEELENEMLVETAPLDEKDRAALEVVRKGDRKARRAALARLLGTGKNAVHYALGEILGAAKDPLRKCDLLVALGQAGVQRARPAIEARLGDEEATVRGFAAVCLEDLAGGDCVPALLKRLKREDDATVRKNLVRALGACGGPVADRAAAKALLRAIAKDRQRLVSKHAALALHHYAGAGAKLVRKKLEQLVTRTEDGDVRCAIAYALVAVGNAKSSVRALERALKDTKETWRTEFVWSAVQKLNGEKARFSGSWLYWEDKNDPARKEPEKSS